MTRIREEEEVHVTSCNQSAVGYKLPIALNQMNDAESVIRHLYVKLQLRFALAVTCWSQCSCSTPGPVSVWMGDRLWTGKPSWHRTRQPGLLSLSYPVWVGRMSIKLKLGSK